MLGVTEQEGAEFFSVRSGDSTIKLNSTKIVKKTFTIAQMIPQYQEMDSLGKRRLLTPDEILRFPNDELLIILRGENVLRAKKFDYTGHPYARKLVRSSIFDYNPEADTTAPHTEPEKPMESHNGHEEPPIPQTEKKPGAAKLFAAAKPPDEF